MAVARTNSNIVVWEWQDDDGQWLPYDPKVCQQIEKEYASRSRSKVDFQVTLPFVSRPIKYQVDVTQMVQKNMHTGKLRHLQRTILLSTSPLANGWIWEWERGSKRKTSWLPYSTQLNEFFEAQFSGNKISVDFTGHFNTRYTVNFSKKTQENLTTGHKRAIQRRRLTSAYPGYQATTVQPISLQNSFNPTSPYLTSSHQFTNTFQSNNSRLQPPPYSAASHAPPTNTVAWNTEGANMKSVTLPPCPPGGISCQPQASTGTVPVSQVLKNFTKKIDVDPKSTDPCAICQSLLTEDSGFGSSEETVELSQCKHVFHRECIEATYSHGVQNGCIVCPACNKMHGIKTGNQPPGIMSYSQMTTSLPGYPGCGTIRIEYNIQAGVQTAEHPHPGRAYRPSGFPRIGYLPGNDDGKRVALLLIEAWKRRLIFTVGQSSTTGADDCVTWNGIHHKTEMNSRRGYGYPDDTYLDRVICELEAVGVVP